jgi:hypothetical protein
MRGRREGKIEGVDSDSDSVDLLDDDVLQV